MPVFDFRFTVDAPLSEVAAFHYSPGAFEALSPPMMPMSFHIAEPIGEGSIAEFTMWAGPIPVRWRAQHSDISEEGFTDTQLKGPMASWVHRHSFQDLGDGRTEIHEHIEYEHDSGMRGMFSRMLFAKVGLVALFTMRKWATRKQLARRQASASR
jgi:ligand-binding SRPBCC domain-containing protein